MACIQWAHLRLHCTRFCCCKLWVGQRVEGQVRGRVKAATPQILDLQKGSMHKEYPSSELPA